MILERAEIPVKSGMELSFVRAMSEGRRILAAAPGCHAVKVARGVERPGQFILLLEWDSVDAHRAFTKTEEFGRFKQLVGEFVSGPSSVEHFEFV
jgi:heme-degrading monooxygenase HmoA